TIANYIEGWTALPRPFHVYIVNSLVVVVGSIIGNLLAGRLRVRPAGVPVQAVLVRGHARHDDAADPRGDRAAVRAVRPARLDQHVLAADRAEAAGHRRVLRLPDGPVHPGHPARARRGRPDRRLRALRHLLADHPAAVHARDDHDGDLHLHLD